jgi:protoporphyrinogen oxidase
VTVLEQNEHIGGNAGSFELDGIWLDYGSHRLHPSCDPAVLADIRQFLGADLLDRPRHGRILLKGRWIHFPLKPFDLALRLPPQFALGVGRDMVTKVASSAAQADQDSSFAAVMERSLGRTICQDFYFPYARKIWGLEPEDLSSSQARRRVSANSPAKMLRKVASSIPGLKPPGAGRFFYPRRGFGQISQAYASMAAQNGVQILLGSKASAIEKTSNGRFSVQYAQAGQAGELEADHVWSTIPMTALAGAVRPQPPDEVLAAARRIETRAMILVYLVLNQPQFSEYDAHYFPGSHIPITRLSEPKNYSASREPADKTVLCAELPCSPQDTVWRQSDEELGRLVEQSLRMAGIPIQTSVEKVHVRKLRNAYPIYRKGYEDPFQELDEWLGRIDGLLTFGRQGLFAHDNTHHALFMAYSAVDCLDEQGRFNQGRWQEYRKIFERHVVED